MNKTAKTIALIAILSGTFVSAAEEKKPTSEGITLTLNNETIVKDGAMVPVQANFTHKDGKNGLAFSVAGKLLRDSKGQLMSLYLTNDPLVSAKSKPHKESEKWMHESPGTLTGQVDLAKGTEFNQTLALWLDEKVVPPYGETVPVFLQISDDLGVLFAGTISLQIPAKDK